MLITSKDIQITSTVKKRFCIKKKGDLTLVYGIAGVWGEFVKHNYSFYSFSYCQYEKFSSEPTENFGRLSC